MVKIGTVWDRTTEVVGGRMGMLAGIAAPTLLLPSVVHDAYAAYATPGTTTASLIGLALSIVTIVLTIWGQLATLAVATDPATTRADAGRQANARLLPALGVTIVLAIIAMVVVSPIFIALAASGFDFSAAANPATMPTIAPNVAGFSVLYGLLLIALSLWAGGRLILVNPVVLNERLGLGAIRRSIVLTRGLTWKLIGVVILFVIVLAIAASAAQLVSGLVFRLILGSDGVVTATFLAGVVAAVVTSGFTVLATVFTAQLYVAVCGAVPASE